MLSLAGLVTSPCACFMALWPWQYFLSKADRIRFKPRFIAATVLITALKVNASVFNRGKVGVGLALAHILTYYGVLFGALPIYVARSWRDTFPAEALSQQDSHIDLAAAIIVFLLIASDVLLFVAPPFPIALLGLLRPAPQ